MVDVNENKNNNIMEDMKNQVKNIIELVMIERAKKEVHFAESSYEYLLEIGQNLIENALKNPKKFLEDKNVQAVVKR